MPLSNFLKWCQESKLRKKHTGTSAGKKELVPPSFINPQSQSPFFRLPLEIRITIYELLFGDRPIHYERDWNETEKKWVVNSFVCFEPFERIDWDECAGRGGANAAKFWEMWKDTGALALCWKG
ncbi:hypothetical protein N7488_000322 [Penicillium malachiteum]|nr:hypothetical protein N7488_000322 [Penicillium malachiteum]